MRKPSGKSALCAALLMLVPISLAIAGDLPEADAHRISDATEIRGGADYEFRYRYYSAEETEHLELRGQFHNSPCAQAGELVDQYIDSELIRDSDDGIPLETFVTAFWDRPTEDLLEEVMAVSCSSEDDADWSSFADEPLRAAVISRKFFAAPDYSQALEMIRSEGSKLSPEVKRRMMQMFGAIYFECYDPSRSWSKKEDVKTEEIFQASQRRFLGADPDENVAGICGDLALASGEIARAMGYRNVHIIGFDTPNGAPHSTLYYEDPGNPSKSYRLNYEALSRDEGIDGAAGLYQGDNLFNSDVTLKYRVYNREGHIVYRVPSELQTTLVEALRGEGAAEDLSPGYLQGGNLSSATASRKIAGIRSTGRLYGAIDSQGRKYLGIGMSGRRDFFDGVGLDGGVSATRLASHNTDSDLIFSYLEMRADSPGQSLAGRGQARVYGAAAISTLFGRVGREYEGCDGSGNYGMYQDGGLGGGGFGWARSMDVRAVAGLKTDIGERADRVQFTIDGNAEFNLAWDHIMPAPDAQYGLFFNQALLDVKAMYRLTRFRSDGKESATVQEGHAFLMGNATCILDRYGHRIITTAGIRNGGTQIELDYRGRVESDSPLFREASFRQAGAALMQSFGRNFHLSARVSVPMEKGRDTRFGLGAHIGLSPMK